MNHFDDPTGSPPPPAYSEQEFDQKISTAAELSLATHRAQPQHEEDAWEVWDEAVFESAASGLNKLSLRDHRDPRVHDGGSNKPLKNEASGSTLPLRIHKKNPSGGASPTPAGKQKPSWLAEAEGAEASTSEAVRSAAPAYTPGPSSTSASSATLPNPYSEQDWAATSPIQTLPDPYSEQDWTATSPSPALPDPYPDQSWSAGELTTVPAPPPPRSQLAPPPFPSSNEGRLSSPYDSARRISAPAISEAGPPPSISRPLSLPVQTNPQTSLNVDTSYQLRATTPQDSTPPYSIRNDSRYSLRPSPETRSTNYEVPSQLTPRNGYRHSVLPQSTALPRLNFELSAAYGKGPATKVNDAQPQPVYNAAAFYNSAVSAHLTMPGRTEQRRQPHRIPPSPSMSNFQSNQPNIINPPNWLSQLPSGAGTSYNPHAAASYSTGIRSPTPSYPAGTNNTMPQILVTEGQYPYYPAAPHSMDNRGQNGWTNYNPYH